MKKLKNRRKEKEDKIEVSGETKTFFCPEPGCGGLLYFDRRSGFHKCSKCGRYWKHTGKKIIIRAPRVVRKEEKKEKR